MSENKEINLIRVELETNLQPIAKYKHNKDFIYWGEYNNYPNYLIELYKRDAVHGAIIRGKKDAVFGKGLTYNKETLTVIQQAKIQQFLQGGNPNETWNDLFRKICFNYEVFDGFALQIIWKIGGMSFDVYVMQIGKLRKSVDGKKIYYCEKWINDDGSINSAPHRHPSFTCFDIFNPNIRTGTQIYFFKDDNLNVSEYGNLYPEPNYAQCIQDIETNIEITNHSYNTLKNGMSASSVVTLFNGEPDRPEKKKIAEMFRNTHTGSNNAGRFILNFVNKDGKPAEVTTLTASDSYQQFEQMAKRVQQNIFTGHNANPILFGVQTDNGISNPTGEQILVEWDRFLKAYVEKRQYVLLNEIKYLASVVNVDLTGIEIEQTSPVSHELPLENSNIYQLFNKETLANYVAKKYGVEVIEDTTQTASVQNEAMVNENIKNLTGRQWQNINRIKNNLGKGKISKDQAALLLRSGYGLNNDDIEILLAQPTQQFNQEKESLCLQLFEKYAIDDNDDEVISTEFVHDTNEALRKEFKFYKKFAEDQNLNNAVLDILKGNPQTPVEQIAKQLGTDVETIKQIIDTLSIAGLILITSGVLSITEKGLAKSVEPVVTETYTVYKYVTRDDVPKAKQTRNFCARLLSLSNNGKRWTRDAIDNISNEFGEDAWTYRGGFYSNPNTGEITPYCRHIWQAITKVRRKK